MGSLHFQVQQIRFLAEGLPSPHCGSLQHSPDCLAVTVGEKRGRTEGREWFKGEREGSGGLLSHMTQIWGCAIRSIGESTPLLISHGVENRRRFFRPEYRNVSCEKSLTTFDADCRFRRPRTCSIPTSILLRNVIEMNK